MDTILLVVTGLSLAMAGAMAVLLVRVLREERRRSDARVALLEQLAAEPLAQASHLPRAATVQHGSTRATAQRGSTRGTGQRGSTPGTATVQHGSAPEDTRHVKPATSPLPRAAGDPSIDDLDLLPGSATSRVTAHEIFLEHDAPSPWPRRFVVVGAMAAVLAAVAVGWNTVSTVPGAPLDQPSTQVLKQPLELLALQHAQQDGTLVISGLVQNPRSAAALAGVQATVLLIGPDGRPMASGRAALDFTTLGPGDESPFVIRVPVSSTVARYRVGFRGEDDRVLGHVDRRTSEAVARKQGS